MAQRIDFLFSNSGGYGWSESYWNTVSPLTPPYTAINLILAARAYILATDCQINYVRIQSAYSRSPLLLDAEFPNPGPVFGAATGASGPDFVALVLRVSGALQGVGRIFLRGVPEAEYVADGFNFSPTYLGALNNFTNMLISGGIWGIRTSSIIGARPRLAASALTPVSPRGYSFVAQTNVVSPGSVIVMHQATTVGYNGRKQVVGITGAGPYTVTVGGAQPQAPDSGMNNPYYTTVAYSYPLITNAVYERISRRSPGRFFGQRRGRRSTTLPLRR
jgi:hypothetical protein